MSLSRGMDKWTVIHPTEYHSVLKSALSSHGKAWRNPKCTLLSERSRPGEATCCTTATLHARKGKTLETGERSVAARVSREGGREGGREEEVEPRDF